MHEVQWQRLYYRHFGIQQQRQEKQEMFCSSCGVICEPDANFCRACGCRVAEDAINNIDEVITGYFYRGYQYSAIIGLLKKYHRADIHVRTLKRKLKELGLKRREANCDEETV